MFRTVNYDCTFYRDKERFMYMLTKLNKTYKHVKVILVEPKSQIYRIEAYN